MNKITLSDELDGRIKIGANGTKPVALLSVFHKGGIIDFARELQKLGWDLVASGGTAKTLREADLSTYDVADLVGGGAILGHRVVTLSREVHAGLLATDTAEDKVELEQLGIPRINLVCVDLYPLEEAIRKNGQSREQVIEMTDIGGPTMLRSAAKGRRIVICDPADRARVLDWLKAGRPDEDAFITALCAKAEFMVAKYCLASARYHSDGGYEGILGRKIADCAYGENAWQTPAASYSTNSDDPLALEKFQLVEGSAPSYNNYRDIDRLLQTITHIAAAFDVNFEKVPLIAVGVKHGNPCGTAVGDDPTDVLKKMIAGNPLALSGGLVGTNFMIQEDEAKCLRNHLSKEKRVLDGVIAPGFFGEAIVELKRKKHKCRMLANPVLATLSRESLDATPIYRQVRGGFLKQPNYTFVLDLNSPEIEHCRYGSQLNKTEKENVLLVWAIGSTSNSNTITLTKNRMLIGNGVGQQDRVGAAKLAIELAKRNGHDTQDAVAYSDSFFPFPDGPEELAAGGIGIVLASSGSIRDEEIKFVFQKHGIRSLMIPDKTGRGFFGH